MTRRRLMLASALALAGSAALAQKVKVEFNDQADFTAFKTYAWKDTQEPASPPLDHEALTREVERELEAKGFTKDVSGRPDLLVRYFAKVDKRTKSSSRMEEGYWQPSERRTLVELSRIKELKLILELYRPAELEPAWSAVVTDALAPPERLDMQIERTVARLLAQYPPKPP
jgi:hypothetical protein